MKRIIQSQVVVLASVLAALGLTLAACGGGGSSAGAGGGGGTTVAGVVKSGGVAGIGIEQGRLAHALIAASDYLIADANAAVYQVSIDCTGGYTDSQPTDANGNFVFTSNDPTFSGDCTISVEGNPVTTVAVTSGTKTEVEVNDNGGTFVVSKTETENSTTTAVKVEVEDSQSASSDDSKSSTQSESSGSDDSKSETQSSSSDDSPSKEGSNSGSG